MIYRNLKEKIRGLQTLNEEIEALYEDRISELEKENEMLLEENNELEEAIDRLRCEKRNTDALIKKMEEDLAAYKAIFWLIGYTIVCVSIARML
jgi:cytochrome c-type biogenesis protein CcmH/NrfG